jgi:hypothetical protein
MTKIKINSRKYTTGKSCRSRPLHARIVGQRSGNPLETFKREVCKKQKKEPEDKDGAVGTWKRRGSRTRQIQQAFSCITFLFCAKHN